MSYKEILQRLNILEQKFGSMGYDHEQTISSEIRRKFKAPVQSNMMWGVYLALCIDTKDPWKQNRIRFYSPYMHDPEEDIDSLPWASPCSPMGGIDDSGCNWVPPAGSTVIIMFENGYRSSPFYFGTTWGRDRGPEGNRNFGISIPEFYEIYEGRRNGYLLGANDGSQVLPPWNTENCNGIDIDSTEDISSKPEATKFITSPNIYGFKTPGKHMYKQVDGDPKCGSRWKRIEILSGDGNLMIFKDDHLHPSGQWASPDCVGGDVVSNCEDEEGNPVEINDCQGTTSNASIRKEGSNPFFKHENECRPYKGVGTPENNKCDLPQSGIQLLSISGQSFIMSDEVNEPRGEIGWEKSTKPFDFGCDDTFLGKIQIKSSTGQEITLDDSEDVPGVRGISNGIKLLSACGNLILLSDHTIGQVGETCTGGPERGITLKSTSNNTIEMHDPQNLQCSETRQSGGTPTAKAINGVIRLRTGYGLMIQMSDTSSQEFTENQNITILAPQHNNQERQAHFLRFQEKPDGPGQIVLRAGGDYVVMTYDNLVEVVGDTNKNPANRIEIVSRNNVVVTNQNYINMASSHLMIAENNIFLLAQKGCCNGTAPCIYPAVYSWNPALTESVGCIVGIGASKQVFISGGPSACFGSQDCSDDVLNSSTTESTTSENFQTQELGT